MNEALLGKIRHLLTDRPELCGTPASSQEITDAENVLQVKFHSQYIEFIQLFGGAFGGIGIHAFSNGKLIGKSTVIDLTNRFRGTYRENIPEELKSAYAISDDGAGNPILMNSTGRTFIFFHDSNEVKELYSSLESLLKKSFPL